MDILAAAEEEFAAAGFAGGRVERIAARARVNKQLLFHYFGSKDGLFTAALTTLLRRAEPPPAEGRSPVEEVRALLGALQRTASEAPGLVAILADADARSGFPLPARAAVHDWRERLAARLTAALVEGQRRGHFRDDLEPAPTAAIGLAAALGIAALGGRAATAPIGHLLTDYCAWR